jgi:hypothetical protein
MHSVKPFIGRCIEMLCVSVINQDGCYLVMLKREFTNFSGLSVPCMVFVSHNISTSFPDHSIWRMHGRAGNSSGLGERFWFLTGT